MKKTYKDVDASLLNAIPNPDKKTYEIKIFCFRQFAF